MHKPSLSGSTIRNFRTVHERLFRGGQPTEKGLKELAALGVRTVLSLRSGRRTAANERRIVESLGMTFVNVPVYYLSLPDDACIERLLRVMDDPANHPVFVHCYHGIDRTGLFVALYRMSRMGWHVEEAYSEMKRCGFYQLRVPHFKWVLWNYARRIGKLAPKGNNRSGFSVKRS